MRDSFRAPIHKPANIELEAIETASLDELRSLQLQRLKKSIDHAYRNVPHFRNAFKEKGVLPSDLQSLQDLAHFPLINKDDLRAGFPYGMLAVPRASLARIHASSGTTGKPTVVASTLADLEQWSLLVARSMRAAGARPGDLVHVAYGYGLFTGGLGAHYGAEKLGCTVLPASGGQTEKQVGLIADLKPDVIMVTPSYMLVLIEEMERQGIDPRQTSLRRGIFGAEPWTEAMRFEIESRANIDALDIYGLSEVMGPGVASEVLESKDGAVLWEDHFYPEIIDPITEEVLPDGAFGELVLTTLTREAMPMVRYRTRDMTRLLPPSTRSMRRMDRITGRSDDMMIIRGVNVFPSQIEQLILGMPDLSPQYQLVIERDGHLDTLEVRVERRLLEPPLAGTDLDIKLTQRIKDMCGVSASVTVLAPDSIERTLVGKARRVVDKRVLR
jgi:phenylacetate-CoA ligase